MPLLVKNFDQALDAVAFYAAKTAAAQIAMVNKKFPAEKPLVASYAVIELRAGQLVLDAVNGSDHFHKALERHAKKLGV